MPPAVNRNPFPSFQGKRFLVTGHSGFTGAWLTEWLYLLGGEILGISLPPSTGVNLHGVLEHDKTIQNRYFDIRDDKSVFAEVSNFEPDAIFHLAAQPLVRTSYSEPFYTFDVNFRGTLNILEAARLYGAPHVLIITTDKVYAPTNFAHRESDPLGGKDPYSASKSAADILTRSYSESFSKLKGQNFMSARAGNIIGGGDFSHDRLFPDIVRSLRDCTTLKVRFPEAVRPWQHVLGAISGYFEIMHYAFSSNNLIEMPFWNISPSSEDQVSVREILIMAEKKFPEMFAVFEKSDIQETEVLKLANEKIRSETRWRPIVDVEKSVVMTLDWYADYLNSSNDLGSLTRSQIQFFGNEYLRAIGNT